MKKLQIYWKQSISILVGYGLLNIVYYPMCHILEPDASNPYYVRVEGGWQTSSIYCPLALVALFIVLKLTNILNCSKEHFIYVLLSIFIIALINYFVVMVIGGVIYA